MIGEAQKKLDCTIRDLSVNINCKVDNCKEQEKYPTRFFTKEGVLIRAINIYREWIEDTNPKENYFRPELRSLIWKLKKEAKRKRR